MGQGGALRRPATCAQVDHSSPRTTELYNRSEDEVSLDEYERVGIRLSALSGGFPHAHFDA
jgi:hypothetical protein